MGSKGDQIDALESEAAMLEEEIRGVRAGSNADLVDTTVRLKGLEEKLYSCRAQLCRVTGDAAGAKRHGEESRQAADLKVRAARALTADQLRQLQEEDGQDEQAREMMADLQ